MPKHSNPRGPKVERTCQTCGATFWRFPSHVRTYGGRYCSKPCASKSAHPRRDIAERFWEKVDKRGNDECWKWIGTHDGAGYGVIGVGGHWARPVRAHRLSWEIAHGEPVPNGLYVLHECDNPPCVNPAHLTIGTQSENLAHMAMVGRSAKGERNANRTHPERMAKGVRMPHAKMTDDTVRAMRSRHTEGGVSINALARQYGVSVSTARRVILGERWKHVE